MNTHNLAASLAASLSTVTATAPVMAQAPVQKSAVVKGADNFYKSDKVTTQKVTFKNNTT